MWKGTVQFVHVLTVIFTYVSSIPLERQVCKVLLRRVLESHGRLSTEGIRMVDIHESMLEVALILLPLLHISWTCTFLRSENNLHRRIWVAICEEYECWCPLLEWTEGAGRSLTYHVLILHGLFGVCPRLSILSYAR